MGFVSTRSSPGYRRQSSNGNRICTGLLLLIAAAADCWPWGSDPLCPPGPEPLCPISPVTDFDNFFPHPTDCHYYIQCDGSRKPLCRPCAPTTFFSPTILNCVWPLDAKCEHNATTRQENLLPPICGPDRCETGLKKRDYSDCTHYFMCNGTFEDRRECPAGQHFDTRKNDCDDQCTAGCENPCTIPECQNYCKCYDNTPPKVVSGDCTLCEVCRGGQIVKESCPLTQCRTEMCTRTKHPDDCHGYYDNCTKKLTQCERNLHFNPETQMCEDPCTVGCKPPCEIPGCTCPCDETMPPKVDPHDCTICEVCRGGQIVKESCPLTQCRTEMCTRTKHPDDCHSYYDNCTKKLTQCEINLHFNPETQMCEDPCTVGCKPPCEIPGCTCPCDETMPPKVDPYDCTICEVCRGGQIVKESCPLTQCRTEMCTRTKHPDDCHSYYDNCTKKLTQCERHLHFNPETQMCEDPCTVGCKSPCEIPGCTCPCDETVPPKVDPHDCTICEVCRGGQIVKEVCPPGLKDTCPDRKCCEFTRHESDCHLYYNHCSMTWSRCPGDLHFNEVTRTCDHPCKAGCKDRRDIGVCCPADGEVYEDPCDCETYFLCTNGIKELVKCDEGQQYNSTLGRCDYSCSGGCPKLFAGKPECCASTSGKPEPQCPPTMYPIFLPHPSNGQFFYKCLNGVRSCNRCPLQHRWNTDMDTCDEMACSRPETPFDSYPGPTRY